MASERSKAIWEISTPLPQFVLERAHQRISEQPLANSGIGWRLLELLNRANDALRAPENAIDQTRAAIKRGTLIATGIRALPTRGRSPVLIEPVMMARARVLLLQSALVGTGFRYDDVRLIRKSAIPRSLSAARPNQHDRRSAIVREIVALHKSGQLKGLRKQQVFIVRKRLAEAGIENVGADKSVERIIRQALNME